MIISCSHTGKNNGQLINKHFDLDAVISLLEEFAFNNMKNAELWWVYDYSALSKENVTSEIIIKAIPYDEHGMVPDFRMFLNCCLRSRKYGWMELWIWLAVTKFFWKKMKPLLFVRPYFFFEKIFLNARIGCHCHC